jgi:hypothetical protein
MSISIISDLPPAIDDAKRGSLSAAWISKIVPDRASAREAAIRRAEATPDHERAAVLLAELPNHPLNVLAKEVADWLWREDWSMPKPSEKMMASWTLKGWLEREPWNPKGLSAFPPRSF